MTKQLIFILLLLAPLFAKAQFAVKGTVMDENQTPIAFSNVQLIDNKGKLVAFGTTKSDGTFSLATGKEGVFNLKITHISHQPKEIPITLNETNKEVIKDITLFKNTENLDEIILKVDPKLLEINTDTITYNLKRLTFGTEANLAEVLDKLPGVELNPSGLITVNGKQINKLLIDGEELFKKQHRITTQSITAEMIEGIRYLDKYKDFGNIKDFNNKEIKALDVTIKDKFKNKITGDLLVQGGIKNKALGHTNLYRFGGKLKIGFIGDVNNLGVPSITSQEYDRLITPSGDYKINQKGFNRIAPDAPVFLNENNNISSRENYFGAISMVYKPTEKFKLSLLQIGNYTQQKQQFDLTRFFFDTNNTAQSESRNTASDLLLLTTNVEIGFQPNDKNFFAYNFNITPRNYTDDLSIISSLNNRNSNIDQLSEDNGFVMNNNLNYTGSISPKTLLSLSGMFIKSVTDNSLSINSSQPFLGISLNNENSLKQYVDLDENRSGIELGTTTNITKRTKIESYSGIFRSEDFFTSRETENNLLTNNLTTNRLDSYLGIRFNSKITKKNRLRTSIEYRYLSFVRFNQSYVKKYILPQIYFEHNFKPTRRFDVQYAYDIKLPKSITLNQATLFSNYFAQIAPSTIDSDKIFPEHQFNASYFNLNSITGSSLLTYANYTFASEFLTRNSFFDENQVSNTQFDIGFDRHQVSLGLDLKGRIKKLKLKLFSNTQINYTKEENNINFQDNVTQSTFLQQTVGVYSIFRNGINFSTGIKYELYQFKNSFNDFETTAYNLKPYLSLNGNFLKNKLIWSLNTEYQIYETDIDQSSILNIQPNIRYKLNNNWEFRIIGNNILNINSPDIVENINNSNFSESRISKTLEGYLTLGVYHLLK